MAAVAGGHHAVEEVHAPGHALDDVAGSAHAHEVPGLVLGHVGLHRVDDLVHHLRGLPHREPPDGVAVAVDLGDLVHVPHPQVRKRGALVDAEEHLPRVHRVRQGVEAVVLGLAPLQPAGGALTAGLGVFVGRGVLHALVKGHGDVAAQVGLDLHGLLRPHEDPVPVDVGGEGDPLLPDLPQRGQGEHLEPAGVRQDRAVPVHELVEPPHLPDDMVARPQVQVVGVAELDLAAHLLQIMGGDAALDGPLCAYVHEHRRLDHAAVGAGEFAAPGAALGFQHFEHPVISLISNLFHIL